MASAQAAYNAALSGGSGDYAALEQAVAAAESKVTEKHTAVIELEAQVNDLGRDIETYTAQRDAAQAALDNYAAPDNSALVEEVERCQAAYDEAVAAEAAAIQAITDAENEVVDCENSWRSLDAAAKQALETANNYRTNELATATNNAEAAQIAYENAGGNDHDLMLLKAKYDRANDTLNSMTVDYPNYQKAIDEARRAWNDASLQENYAKTKLERALELELEALVATPIEESDYPEFFALNEYAAKVQEQRDLIAPVTEERENAKAQMDEAQNNFNIRTAEYNAASDAADEAQRVYDELLKQQNGGASDSNDQNKGGSSNTTKPAASPKNGGASDANMTTADDKSANDDKKAEDEEKAEKPMQTASKTFTAADQKPATFFGLDPMIVGIVAGAIVIAAAAAIITAVVRHRRKVAAK